MYNAFLKYINENGLVSKDDRILLAVSGGIDSMVMADLFVKAGIDTGIAHCNFTLRGQESDEDEEMVRKYSINHKIPFYTIRFNTEEYAERKGISIQMAARELRYEWFERIRKNNGFDCIAIAHNLNDSIETLLINLTRGTGVAGLSGMKRTGNRIIRPLLFSTRASIEEYQKKQNIQYHEDSSNAETKYIRNKIRHHVIPLLKDINPSVEFTLNDTAERMSSINDIINSYIDDLRKKIFRDINGNLRTEAKQLTQFLGNKTIIYELFRPYGITNNNLNDLYKIFRGRTGKQLFTSTHRILKNRQEIIIAAIKEEKNDLYSINNVSDLKNICGIISARIVKKTSNFSIPMDCAIACIDLEKVSFPLIIREWRAGDYFYPFGMKQKKKLSDYLTDRKFSRFDKEKLRVMESAGKIVWLIGEKIDNRFRITEFTENILIIEKGVKA
jgi:tRNA(Ile)-lysidine synthase